MKKLIVLCLSLFAFLSLSVGLVSAKNADPKQAKAIFYNVTGGSSDNVDQKNPYEGFVTLVNPSGDNSLLLNGHIKGLTADTEYSVWVRNLTGYSGPRIFEYLPLGYFKLVTFTTNSQGIGEFHYQINSQDLPSGTYPIQVAINFGDPIGVTVAATVNPAFTFAK